MKDIKKEDKKDKVSKVSKVEKFFESRYTILTIILLSSFLTIFVLGFKEVLTSTLFVSMLIIGDIFLAEYFYRKYQSEKE